MKSNNLPLPIGCPQPPHPIDEEEAEIWIRMAPKWWRAGLLDDLTSSIFEQLVHATVQYLQFKRDLDELAAVLNARRAEVTITAEQDAEIEAALRSLNESRSGAAEWRKLARLFAADCCLLPGGREGLALLDSDGEDAELKRILEIEASDEASETNGDRNDVLRRLETWAQRIDAIGFDQDGNLQGNRELAAERYRVLKDDLKTEHRRCKSSRRDPLPTPAEVRWYDRTVGRAATNPGGRWDQDPSGWRNFLSDARTEFAMAISRLKRDIAENPFGN